MEKIIKGEGRCGIVFQALCTDEGVGVILVGGEKTHIGGNVLAVPRGSLTGDGQSCDLYITPVPGHKDTEAAALVAEYLCRRLAVPVSVAAGIHSKGLSMEEIQTILHNCKEAAREYADVFA